MRKIQYRTTRNESTRCNFCKNNCLRTFIDVRTEPAQELVAIKKVTKVPLMVGEQRLIIATCEKGLVEDVNEMKDIRSASRSFAISIRISWITRRKRSFAQPMRRALPIRYPRAAGRDGAKEQRNGGR